MRKVLLFNPKSEFYAMPQGLWRLVRHLTLRNSTFALSMPASIPMRRIRFFTKPSTKWCQCRIDSVLWPLDWRRITFVARLERPLSQTSDRLGRLAPFHHAGTMYSEWRRGCRGDRSWRSQAFADLLRSIDTPAHWIDIPGLCVASHSSHDGAQRTATRPMARMDQFPAARYELLMLRITFDVKVNARSTTVPRAAAHINVRSAPIPWFTRASGPASLLRASWTN